MEYRINNKRLDQCDLNESTIYDSDIPFSYVLKYVKKYFKIEYNKNSLINYRTIHKDYFIGNKGECYICSDVITDKKNFINKKLITRDFIVSKILDSK